LDKELCISYGGPSNITISGEIKLLKIINAFAILKVDLIDGINCIASCKAINLFNGKIVLKKAENKIKSKSLDLGLSGPSLSLILPGLKDLANIKKTINKMEFTANVYLEILTIKSEAIIEISPKQF